MQLITKLSNLDMILTWLKINVIVLSLSLHISAATIGGETVLTVGILLDNDSRDTSERTLQTIRSASEWLRGQNRSVILTPVIVGSIASLADVSEAGKLSFSKPLRFC